MLVYIDSSILCTDYYMRGAYFELLKNESTIVLSEIVIDEVKNKHREMIEEEIRNIDKGVTSLNRMLSEPLHVETDTLLSKEQVSYEDFIDTFIIGSGMTIAQPYPEVDHRKIVERAIQRKKPFKSDGKSGYRDYLVWTSFLNLAKTYANEEVCFITLNKKDFSDEKDDKKLHKDLVNDLAEYGIDLGRFQYWISLKSFVDSIIKPSLLKKEESKNIANSLLNDEECFILPLEKLIFSKMKGLDLNNHDVVLIGEDPSIANVYDIYDMGIDSISEISDEEYLLEIRFNLYGAAETYINKAELATLSDEDMSIIHISNSDWNERYALLEEELDLNVVIDVIYNVDQKTFSSLEISEIDDGDCPYCSFE